MAIVIQMPKLSDTMEEGGIASWLKKEGDPVKEGEPLVEIETDKATMEYASPEAGILLKILAVKGTSYVLGAPIAVFGKKGESFDPSILNSQQDPSPQDVILSAAKDLNETPKDLREIPKNLNSPSPDILRASPLAKKIAKEKGIDLKALQGSGPHGRIIERDLVNVSLQEKSQPVFAAEQDQKIPLSMMRKTIAKRLVQGKNTAPHFYLTTSANMGEMLKWRGQLNKHPEIEAKTKPKVSVNDLVVLAVAKALRKHPVINSFWQEDHILQKGNIHISVAVALESGLITPVVKDADKKGVYTISQEVKDLVQRAKAGGLQPDEYSSGTFTVSNLGMTVVDEFTAIINPPQSCILAIGRTQKVPHVVQDKIEIQERMRMTLSCDHRVVDGMAGAQFLETLVQYLEFPLLMLA